MSATPDGQPPHDPTREASRSLACRGCGSHRLRRSHPKNLLEHLARLVTPLRFHRCADCGARGLHLAWITEPSVRPHHLVRPAPPPGRRQELRDALAARTKRRKIAVSVVVAVLLGMLAALYASAGS